MYLLDKACFQTKAGSFEANKSELEQQTTLELFPFGNFPVTNYTFTATTTTKKSKHAVANIQSYAEESTRMKNRR